jgi:hypothetical protein
MIYGRILHLDDLRQQELEESDGNTIDDEPFSGHIYLGAAQSHATFESLEEVNKSQRTFNNFRKKFMMFLKAFFKSHNIPLPTNGISSLEPTAQDTVSI